MQDNTITLAVDVANNGTSVDQVFNRYLEETNRTTYRGPGDTLVERNQMAFYRTPPKRSGNYLGSAKSGVKLTLDIDVVQADGTTTKAPIIVDLSFSVPVGANPVVSKNRRQHALAVLDREDIIGKLMDALEV